MSLSVKVFHVLNVKIFPVFKKINNEIQQDKKRYRIVATGYTSSIYSHNSQLISYIYLLQPEDGIYDFDFVAEGNADIDDISVLVPVMANYIWELPSDKVKGVRIHGSDSTSIVAEIPELPSFPKEDLNVFASGDVYRKFENQWHRIPLTKEVLSELDIDNILKMEAIHIIVFLAGGFVS